MEIKLFGSGIIIFASVLTGMILVNKNKQRESSLSMFILFIKYIKNEISYSRRTLSEITKTFAADKKSKKNKFLQQLEFNCNSQTLSPYSISAINALNNTKKSLSLSETDLALLSNFFNDVGKGDAESQLALCSHYLTLLDEALTDAKSTAVKKNKMTTQVSFLSGLFIVILLI